ncbi:MAG: VapC toxin family PIN domain ribonuclease [Actinobacteria bacterium]|nr:VapC toxin family PIN domain ribonuclease [Actinomycetota bacterium]
MGSPGSGAAGALHPGRLAFVRLVSNPRVFTEPESISDAWGQVEAWLDAGPAWVPTPTERHAAVLPGHLAVPGLRATDVPDAHLAALAVEHGLRLASSDSGFARFAGLDWFNPLAPA